MSVTGSIHTQSKKGTRTSNHSIIIPLQSGLLKVYTNPFAFKS